MKRAKKQAGSALLLVVIVSLVLAGVAGAFLALSAAGNQMTEQQKLGLQALYIAETAAAVAVTTLNANPAMADTTNPDAADGVILPTEDPALQGRFGTGGYNITIALWGMDALDNDGNGAVDAADANERNYLTVTAQGYISGDMAQLDPNQVQAGGAKMIIRQVECIVARTDATTINPLWRAFFAGNSSGLPYSFALDGTGGGADTINNGDVFVNGNLNVSGAANIVNGAVVVSGTATDASSAWDGLFTVGSQPGFDIAGRNYPSNHDYNVNNMLATGAPGVTFGVGASTPEPGVAAQNNMHQILDRNNPAHIFARAPGGTFRGIPETPGVPRFFFEDRTHEIMNDGAWDGGADASWLEFSPGANRGRVYFIQGDLYIHNTSSYSYQIHPPPGQDRVTAAIVVQGNIIMADNLFYTNTSLDGLALIAIRDPMRSDSGNFRQGDPVFGTTEACDFMIYAENNYYVDNLGSSTTTNIRGNVAAGNQVVMSSASMSRRFLINYDQRLRNGQLNELAGLLPSGGSTTTGTLGAFTIMAWRTISPNAEAATTGYEY